MVAGFRRFPLIFNYFVWKIKNSVVPLCKQKRIDMNNTAKFNEYAKKVQIKTIDGHLTVTDIRAIKALLFNGVDSGKVGKKTYFITEENGLYSVTQKVLDRGIIPVSGSKLKISTYRATFKIR